LSTWLACLALVAAGLFAHFAAAQQQQQTERAVVYVLAIEGTVDLGMAPYVERVLKEASQAKAAAVILEIETFGGRVDAAVQIRDALLASTVPTVAFVNKRAISAGALIALSAQTLMMSTGSTLGAAAPVLMGTDGAETKPASEKTLSYVRKEFRATAEARQRPLLLAWCCCATCRACRSPANWCCSRRWARGRATVQPRNPTGAGAGNAGLCGRGRGRVRSAACHGRGVPPGQYGHHG
ncbi:SDH family Clp fold serine proteinase, partial [Roseateles sp. GG27B]